jgi:5-methylthioadenosine/S-adenosylhomocysteine deaminase
MLYGNAVIVTMDEERNIYAPGALLIKEGKIADVGEDKALREMYPHEIVRDMEGKILFPGLINAHTHTPMALFRGLADDLPLDTWLKEYIWPMENKMVNPEFIQWGGLLGILEMIASGTTAFNDMYFYQDVLGQAVKQSGMRAVLGQGLIDFPTPEAKSPEEGIQRLQTLLESWEDDEQVDISVCAHAPYTCSSELLKKAFRLAEKYHAPFHIHVAETRQEAELIKEKKHDESIVGYLERLGLLDSHVTAAHCVWISEPDMEILQKRKVKVAHNPTSNLKLASGTAPLHLMLKHGLTVALGTDGAASNNSLDLFREIRLAALLSKGLQEDPELIPAYQALEMATVNGARALGIDDKTGSLEIGKEGDFIVINTSDPSMQPLYRPVSHLVYTVGREHVEEVFVSGRLLYRKGEYFTLDASLILEKSREIAQRIRKESGI